MPFSTACLSKSRMHKHLHIEQDKRVFVIGDLDADFEKFINALHSVNFDYENDVLVMLGDVIDRGNDSTKLIKYVIEHNLIMLLGNHEHMMLASLIDKDSDAFELWVQNGGAWHFNESEENLSLVCDYLKTCPITLKLHFQNEVIALSHTAPLTCDWSNLELNEETLSADTVVQNFLWDRTRVKTKSNKINPGVLFSIHGHNTTKSPYWLGNSYHIDTNYLAGRPTIINVADLISQYRTLKN